MCRARIAQKRYSAARSIAWLDGCVRASRRVCCPATRRPLEPRRGPHRPLADWHRQLPAKQ
eukprot:1394308-Pleurochrysis_carterae.AAC.2